MQTTKTLTDEVNPLGSDEWQINEIYNAIQEADAGDFASEVQVEIIKAKWQML